MTDNKETQTLTAEHVRSVVHTQRTVESRRPYGLAYSPTGDESTEAIVREKAELGANLAEQGIVTDEIKKLVDRKNMLARVEQAIRAKIAVLEEGEEGT